MTIKTRTSNIEVQHPICKINKIEIERNQSSCNETFLWFVSFLIQNQTQLSVWLAIYALISVWMIIVWWITCEHTHYRKRSKHIQSVRYLCNIQIKHESVVNKTIAFQLQIFKYEYDFLLEYGNIYYPLMHADTRKYFKITLWVTHQLIHLL